MFNIIVLGSEKEGVHEFVKACESCSDRVRVHINSVGSADQAIEALKVRMRMNLEKIFATT